MSANNFKSERMRMGLTRKEVGERLGKSEAVIGRWERGEQSPSLFPDTVMLAELYGCTIDYLCGLTSERVRVLTH